MAQPYGLNSKSRLARRRAAQRCAQCDAQLVLVTRRHPPCRGTPPNEPSEHEMLAAIATGTHPRALLRRTNSLVVGKGTK
eukprot:scaffold123282_cov33-Tisochrysis_lutea.AAC.2